MNTYQNTQLVVTLEPNEVRELLDYINANGKPNTFALESLYATLNEYVNPRIGG